MNENRISPGPCSFSAKPIDSQFEKGQAAERTRITLLLQQEAKFSRAKGWTRSARIATDIIALIAEPGND
jgi:hypothetical protein